MTSDPIQLSIVVPCYNEQDVLPECARQLRGVLRRLQAAGKVNSASRIVFVNDGSVDGTWKMIDELCRQDSAFSGICLSRNFGHQGALLAGLNTVPGDAIVSIDADLQDDLAALERMVDCFRDGFDLVYGVRKERKTDTAFKRMTALGFYRTMNILGARTVHNHADFRLMSRRALEALREYHEVNLFLRGIVTLIGFPSTTVEYDRAERFAGETKYPLKKMLALSLSAVTAFSNVPLRLITLGALSGIVFLAGVSIWVLWARLVNHHGLPGWASTLLPMLFIGCFNLLAIGILGEYMARIFEEVKGRPRYQVAALRNLGDPRKKLATENRG